MLPTTFTHRKPLLDYEAEFLEFTERAGVLKCHQGARAKQGLYFTCPQCKGTDQQHGITLLFNEPGVIPKAQPKGRWNMNGRMLPRLTLTEKVYSRDRCGWEGFIIDGFVTWK